MAFKNTRLDCTLDSTRLARSSTRWLASAGCAKSAACSWQEQEQQKAMATIIKKFNWCIKAGNKFSSRLTRLNSQLQLCFLLLFYFHCCFFFSSIFSFFCANLLAPVQSRRKKVQTERTALGLQHTLFLTRRTSSRTWASGIVNKAKGPHYPSSPVEWVGL